MPVFFQHIIDESTRIGIWKIEEPEDFFSRTVPLQRNVSHPVKRLQHLAGRFMLKYLFPDFPHELIKIADTRKPYLPDEQFHFSISHCGDYAAAIVSRDKRVGIDIEIPVEKIEKIKNKFLSEKEITLFDLHGDSDKPHSTFNIKDLTLLWSCKEAVFKWYGNGGVDFSEQIQLSKNNKDSGIINCLFAKTGDELLIHHKLFDKIVLSWVTS
jgi:phosphopantetheinyl transferase